MSTNVEDEQEGDAGADEEAPDDATLAWPEPLSSEERSRIEAKNVELGRGQNLSRWHGTRRAVFNLRHGDRVAGTAAADAADAGAVDTDGADTLDNTAPEA